MKAWIRSAILALFAAAMGCSNISPPGKDGAGTGTDGGPRCADDMSFFESRIWGPILGVQCIGCHSPSGPAGSSALVLETPDQPDFLQHNFASASKVAAKTTGGTSVLLLRPSGKHPEGHHGGTLLPADGPEYGDLAAFVNRVTKGECDAQMGGSTECKAPTPGHRVLRRLTRDEYDKTISDLFQMPSTWGQAFVADVVKNGFDNDAASLVVSPLSPIRFARRPRTSPTRPSPKSRRS